MISKQRSMSGKTQALIQRALAGLAWHGLARSGRRATARPVGQRMHFEALEPRLLMSADILPLPVAALQPQASDNLLLSTAQDHGTLGALNSLSLQPASAWVSGFDTDNFTSALTPLAPLGSFVHAGGVNGSIDINGSTDNLGLDVQAGQAVALRFATPATGLQARLEAWQDLGGGNWVQLGFVEAGQAGEALSLQVLTPVTGSLRVDVISLAGTGAYTLELFLGAALETADSTGAGNALDLGAAMSALPGGAGARSAVIGHLSMGSTAGPLLEERFNSGINFARWAISTYDNAYWYQATDGSGGFALGSSANNVQATGNLTSAVLRVDLPSGSTDGLQLQFDQRGLDYTHEAFSGNGFYGDEFADGLALSVDNSYWVPLSDALANNDAGAEHHRLDLGAALAHWGLQANGQIYLKFLHANTPLAVDQVEGGTVYYAGYREWDNIVVDQQGAARWHSPVSVQGSGPVFGDLARLIDGVTPPDGASPYEAANGVYFFPGDASTIDFDLGSEQRLTALSLSLGAGSGYLIQSSLDGQAWADLLVLDQQLTAGRNGLQRISTAAGEPGHVGGLSFVPTQARYLRLSQAQGTESIGALGELQVRTGDLATADGEDWYRLNLAAGQTASFAMALPQGGTANGLTLALFDDAGQLLTFTAAASGASSAAIPIFKAAADGVYSLRVAGVLEGDYQLAVTRDALLAGAVGIGADITAQPVVATRLDGAHGSSSGRVRVAVQGDNGVVSGMLNDSTRFNFQAVSVNGSQIDSAAELSAFDVVLIGNHAVQQEYEGFAPALRAWVEAGGGLVATGWTVYGGGPATGNIVADLDAVVPVKFSGSYSNTQNGFMQMTGIAHPVVDGIGSFQLNTYSEYPLAGIDAGASLLATVNGQVGVAVAEEQLGRSVYLGPTYFYFYGGSVDTGLDKLLEQSVAWAAGRSAQQFGLRAAAGDHLLIDAVRAGDATAAPVNTLSTVLTLLDASGNVLATSPAGSSLAYTTTQAGSYRVQLSSESGAGDLVLRVSGSTADPSLAMRVLSTSLDNVSRVTQYPDHIDLHFESPLLLTSISADDLTINGQGASGFTVLGPDSLRFYLNLPEVVPQDGNYLLEIAAGALRDAAGRPVAGWSHGFTLDTLLPVITGSTLAQGAVIDGDPMLLHFDFSEALATSLLDAGDVQLVSLDGAGAPQGLGLNLAAASNVSLTSFNIDPGSLGVSVGLPQLAEGHYRLTLRSGSSSFRDLVGLPLNGAPSNPLPSGQGSNSGDDFVLDFAVDQLPQALGELPALGVPGTLVYGKTLAGDLYSTSDQDDFTWQLDAGQVLSVALDPASAGTALRMHLALLDDTLAVVAQADGDAGAGVLLQTLGAGNGLPTGNYTLRVSALTGSGGYRLTAAINARIEVESQVGGSSNDLLANAEDLASSFISLGNGGSRAAVIGSRSAAGADESGDDHYRFTLLQGQRATAALTWASAAGSGSLALDLLAADGTLLASSESGSYTGRVQRIADFRADTAGDYVLRVRGSGSGLYTLALTRNLSLDLTLSSADSVIDISHTLQALGNLGNGAGGGAGGSVRVAVHGGTASFVAALNNSTLAGIAAVSVNGNQLDTLAELQAYDVVIIGNEYYQNEFASFDAVLRNWVEAGGGIVATGWTVYGAGSATAPVRPNIDAIVPVNTSGSYGYSVGGTMVVVDSSHPITDGVVNFTMPSNGIWTEYAVGGIDAGAQVLTTVNGRPAVVVGNAGAGRGVYFGPTLTEWTGTPTGDLDRLIEQAVLWAGGDRADDYLISVNAGDMLTLGTRTPGDGAAQPPNTLDPRLELIDPAGNIVAADSNGAADGRNALLVATATESGTYKLRVRIDSGSGAYVVTVAGATGAALSQAPLVTAVTPANGLVLNAAPASITFQLSEGVRADSVSVSDLVLDSGGSVTGVRLLAGNQVEFSVDIPLVEGAFAYHLTAGAFTDLQGDASLAFGAGFIFDLGGAFVTASIPGADAGAPLNSWAFTFNEAINPASASIADVAVFTGPGGQDLRNQIGSVTVSGNSLLVSFSSQFAPGNYHIEIGPDLRDLAGNPMDQDRDGITGEALQDRFSASTTLRSPDLLPLSLSSAASANFGTPLSVTWSVRNAGNDPARSSWYDRLYLSADTTLGGNDVFLGEYIISPNPLAADASYTMTRQVALPLDAAYLPGTYHLLLVTDQYGQQGEADESNNLLAGTDLIIGTPPLPDLAVANVAAPATVEAGKPVTITWTDRNLGDAATSGGWYDSIYLSSDNQLGGDILLADILFNNAPPIGAGAELARSAQVTIPTNRTGNWYILVRADNYGHINEYLNEGNNFGFTPATVQVVVPTEDLVVSALSTAASATFGQTLNVAWTVSNQGTGPTLGNWTDQLWLSRDGVLSNDDVSLGGFSSAGDTPLAAGAGYERSRDIALPLTSSLGAGTWRVLVQTDANNNEPETNEGNNLRASGTITLALPALPDLTVANVTVPAGLRSGDSADIVFTLTNQGSAAASDFYYRLGLNDSADTAGIDVFLGDFRFNDTLSAGESVQISQRVTLPIDRPGNWYVGVIADVYNAVYEHDRESNNGAVSSLVVLPLPPLVDLRVSNIVAPLDAIAGQQVPISWTVVNQGNASIVAGAFTDNLYLSTDGGASLNIYLGSFTFEGDLAAGAAITRTQSITVPANVAASYTVVVVTDAAGNYYEAGGEFNNRTVDNTRIASVLPPLPNLVVTSITPPSEAFSSTQTEVSWVVRNSGNGASSAPNWLDEVHLSLNTVFGDGDDILLGSANNISYLDVGDSYVGHLTFTVPRGLSGDYHLLVRTDTYNQVFENNLEADNTLASALLHIALTPPPDLQVQAVQAPSQAFSGQPMALNWTITNAGDGRTLESAWYDRVYVSTDNVFDAGDLSLGLFFHAGALNAGASYTQNQQVTLPIGQSGARWFFVVTDALNHVYEHVYEGNNSGLDASATQVLLTPPPDLEVEAVTVPASVRTGSVLNLQFTVRNFGATPTAESYWTDVVYLSTNTTLDAGDLVLGQVGHYGVLGQDSAYTAALAVTVPNSLNGPYFVLVRTDAFSQVFEGFTSNGVDPEGNNLLASDSPLDVQLRPADLLVEAVVAPATGEAGRQISVSWADRNAGVGSVQAPSWTDQILVSSDAIFGDDDDVLLGSVTVGNFLTQTAQVTLPFSLASGNYTLYVRTDTGNQVFEGSGEANNNSVGSALAVTRRTPDLVPGNVSVVLPDTAAGRITVGWRVDNLGANRTDSTYWTDAVYLSRDAALGSGDLFVGSVFRGNPLEAGEGYDVATSFALPAGLGSGDYYLIVRTDVYGQVTEGLIGEANNTTLLGSQAVPLPISVPPAIVPPTPRLDLQVSAVDAPAGAISGQAFDVSWTVSNTGDDPTSDHDWYDAIYLSRDLVFDRNADLYLGYRYHSGGLGAHDSYNASANLTVPLGQSGPFYVFVVTDRGGVITETVETNNAGFDGGFIQVSLAPPADLVVGEITIPANGIPGNLASISYSVSNLGSNAALGSWRDTLYISADSTWDIGDSVFGSAQVYGPLDGGASYSQTVTAALPGLTPGAYHVIVRSDILNNVAESNNANNLAASLDAVQIDVQALSLGVAIEGTLGAGQALFYKVTVGAGETVRVSLDGAGNDNGNELYLRLGSMPTRGRFDAAGKEPFVPDQTAVIPTTQAGVYYVMLYGASGGAQAFSLKAESLPFSLQRVDFTVIGDAGPATLRVDGARFAAGDTFHLTNAVGERIDASQVHIASGSEAYVTFDARGATRGAYTLGADDGHGHSAALAMAVTVGQGTGAAVVVRFDGPAQVRPGRVVLANVVYANQGDADTMAPLLIITSPTGTEFGSTAESMGLSSSVQLLGLGSRGQTDVLRPGDENTLPLLFKSVNAPMRFTAKAYLASSTVAIDFDQVKRSLRMPGLTDTDWDIRWATRLQPRIGSTWGDYVRLVNQLSQRFSTPDHTISDVRELFDLAFRSDSFFLASMQYSAKLLDAGTGAPMAGVEMAIYRTAGADSVLAGHATTDATGTFTVRGLQPGHYKLALARTVIGADGNTQLEYPFVFDLNRNGIADAVSPVFDIGGHADVAGGNLYARLRPVEPTPEHVDAQPAVATDAAGQVHMVWVRDGALWHAVNDGTGWRDAQPLPGNVSGNSLQLVADPRLIDGTREGLLATWRQGEGNAAEVYYSVGGQQPDGSWQWTTAAKLTDNSRFDGAYSVGVDAAGKPVLLVQRKDASNPNDDLDLYGSEFSIQDPQFVSALAERTRDLVAWLETKTDDELVSLGIHRVRFSKSIGNVNIPLIGSVKSEIRVDFQAQIDCTLVYRGNGAFKFDLNVKGAKVEIEGRAGGDVRYEVDKDTCAYVFKNARINAQVAGAVNFPLTWIPFVGPALTAIGVQGRFELAAGGNLIWDAGADFPGWWSRGQGSFRGSLGFNWEGSIPWTGIEAVVRGLVNVNGKWDDQGLGLRDPAISGSVQVRVKHGWFFGGSGWTEYTYSFPGSDLGSTGMDGELLSLDDALYSGSLYDTSVSFGFDPMASGTLNDYAGSGEATLTHNLGTESDPVIAESPDGALWAAWSDASGVQIAQRVGGQWQAPTLLAGSGGYAIRGLTLAFDGSGSALALWNRLDVSSLGSTSTSGQIQAVMDSGGDLASARMTPQGVWSALQAVSVGAGEEQQPVLVRLSDGNLLAAWTLRTGALDAYRPALTVQSALWYATTGSWGATSDVAQGLVQGSLRLAQQASGRALLVWSEAVNSSNATVLRTASRGADGSWASAGTALISISQSLLDVAQAISAGNTAAAAAPIQTSSWGLPSPPENCCKDDKDPPPYDPQPVVPRDPNDILGPSSFGDAHWIAAGSTLAYTIRFENAADAAAPAQEVVVTEQLDADLDWRSFRVDDFGFGDQRIQLDGKSAFYSKRLDYSATRGYLLDVSAAIDVSTGIVTWRLSTIDAATGEVPTDAQLGFLPPNKDANGVKDGRGEGFLSYTVKAKRNATTGTVIDASARIVFDTEEPIDTPAIFHTLDAGKPTSSVAALPTLSESPQFNVSWAGTDAEGGSAIAGYTVYVSTDGSDFQTWLVDTTLTEAIFTGKAGGRYAFYSVARDNAGNVEAAPTEADAHTAVAAGFGALAGLVFDDSDGDGTRDIGEPGRAGWTIFLDLNDDGVLDAGETSTITDDTGAYHFDHVLAGQVVVGQVLAGGWIGTFPSSGRQPVTVLADTTTEGVDFGAFLLGSASGVAFDDVNANGQRDDGEAALAGISVQLDRHADGSIDATVLTLGDGSWRFDNLLAGSYRITAAVPAGRLPTVPGTGSYSLGISSGSQRNGLDFGSVLAAHLSGTAYEDVNGNGQRDLGEAGLAGWTVFLDDNGNSLLDAGERYTLSASDGAWQFDDLLPGSYTVAQLHRNGWLQTAPGSSGGLGGASGPASGPASALLTGAEQLLELPDAALALQASNSAVAASNRAAQQLIGLDALRADARFSGIDGSGVSVVVIDTGIDVDNAFFGPDANGDGIADRILYQYDFANGDADASDRNGHGSNISSLIGAADGAYGGAYSGLAPGADLIALKVFQDNGKGYFSYLENALRWVVAHADEYHVGVVNLSLGDGGNWNSAIARFGLGDELAALAARNIIVTAAAGNSFARFGGAWGVAYPAADPAVLAVGATWSANVGGPWAFSGGSIDYSTGVDRITSFSQRDPRLLDGFAPGTGLVGATASGGLGAMQGSSQASAMMAGVATLAQDLALQTLGRRLSLTEFHALLASTSVRIVDGDDENDNVRNSGQTYGRVDVHALAEAILALGSQGGGGGTGGGGGNGGGGGGTLPGATGAAAHSVTVAAGQTVAGLDFGNFLLGRVDGVVFEDADSNGSQGSGEAGLAGYSVFLDANNNALQDAGEASSITDGAGTWHLADLGPGQGTVRLAPRAGYRPVAETAAVDISSGAHLVVALSANALPTLDAVADVDSPEGQTVTVALAGHDHPGDTLHYSLVGNLPAGVSLDAATGVFSWQAADGDLSQPFTVRVTDSAGSVAERSFAVRVHNVAPTLSASGATTVEEGQDYVLALSASDPGQDSISQWVIDWGDGIVQTLAGNPGQAVHRYAQPGQYAVQATATDEDGSWGVAGPVVRVSAAVLQVARFEATATGFVVRFNRAIDAARLNLYSAADKPLGDSDIVFTDTAGQVVAGSVVVDADQRGLRFVRTGGVLGAGSYSLRLASGAQAFVDAAGGLLDGNRDGTRGDAYITRFDVAGGGAVLSVGDVARGPGQPVNIPATGGGMPITLTNAAGATRIAFTLRYDATLMGFVGASNGAGLPAGSTLSVDLSTLGEVRVVITTGAPLGAAAVELLRLQAGVPSAAAYGARQVLDLGDIVINDGAIAARDDDGLHVVAYLGDGSGDRAYSLLDVTRLQRVITRADSGFSAFPLVDPTILGDINASGTLTSVDAARLQQQVGGLSRPEIPPIPPAGSGFLDQFFATASTSAARIDLAGGLQAGSSAGASAGSGSWISQWLSPVQGGNVAVKVKAGSNLIKLAPKL